MKSSSGRLRSQGSDRQLHSAIRYHFYGRPDGRRMRRVEQNGRFERYSVKARSVMATFDASAVAELLREFAGRSSLRGGNPYRAKAYARAADSLAAFGMSRLFVEHCEAVAAKINITRRWLGEQ